MGKYYADVSISNTTDHSQPYSNMWLWLKSGDTLRARAFLDSLASHQIDTGTVEVAAEEVLDLKVYWVFSVGDLEVPSDDLFALELNTEP